MDNERVMKIRDRSIETVARRNGDLIGFGHAEERKDFPLLLVVRRVWFGYRTHLVLLATQTLNLPISFLAHWCSKMRDKECARLDR